MAQITGQKPRSIQATSSRNAGGIISECLGDFVGSRSICFAKR
jgi:hypothetical protein